MTTVRRSVGTAVAGLVLAGSIATASGGLADAASASPAAPGATVAVHFTPYSTWRAAQQAAGFRLLRPTRTDGLKRTTGILACSCRVAGKNLDQVIASYGKPAASDNHLITLVQVSRPRGRCMGPAGRVGRVIARIRVDGRRATLTRARAQLCVPGGADQPTCSMVVVLQLSWTRHGHSYRVTGVGENRAHLVRTARTLVRVG